MCSYNSFSIVSLSRVGTIHFFSSTEANGVKSWMGWDPLSYSVYCYFVPLFLQQATYSTYKNEDKSLMVPQSIFLLFALQHRRVIWYLCMWINKKSNIEESYGIFACFSLFNKWNTRVLWYQSFFSLQHRRRLCKVPQQRIFFFQPLYLLWIFLLFMVFFLLQRMFFHVIPKKNVFSLQIKYLLTIP